MEENKQTNSNNMLIWIIVILVVIIVGLAFYVWKITWTTAPVVTNNDNWTWATQVATKDVKVTIINDKRCWDRCNTAELVTKLKEIPTLKNNNFEMKDFADAGIKEFLEKNKITKLPAVIFSNNTTVTELTSYLQPISDNNYSLALASTYDPFVKRSDRGFLVLDKTILASLKEWAYIKWNSNAKITWLEYSDLQCTYCIELYKNGTSKDLKAKYKDNLNIIFRHFPLDFHKNAKPAALVTECLAEQKWGEAFYALIGKAFSEKKTDKDYLVAEAVKLWADKTKLEKCISDSKFSTKIDSIQKAWAENFRITWTPWNVLINNDTGEYEIISGAHPTSEFEKIIDWLMK